MNDAQTLVLIHAVAWPILIWLLSKTWSAFHSHARQQLTIRGRGNPDRRRHQRIMRALRLTALCD